MKILKSTMSPADAKFGNVTVVTYVFDRNSVQDFNGLKQFFEHRGPGPQSNKSIKKLGSSFAERGIMDNTDEHFQDDLSKIAKFSTTNVDAKAKQLIFTVNKDVLDAMDRDILQRFNATALDKTVSHVVEPLTAEEAMKQHVPMILK